jgi:hypothetical protein
MAGIAPGKHARIPGRARIWLMVLFATLLLLVVSAATSASASTAGANVRRTSTPETTTFPVTGIVEGYSESNVTSTVAPIADDSVSVVPSSCTPYFDSTGTCVPSVTTTTDSAGAYTLLLPNGTFYLYSSPHGEFGGDSESVTVSGDSETVPAMKVFFELSYTNSTFVLPDFSALSGYVDDHSGTQVPVLSYTSDGAFYINSSDDLVYYSFPAQTVRFIAPWEMLYDQIGYVGELNNYFYLTLDGAYAYELGCDTADCAGDNLLIEYAVNISTGRTFTWNTEIPAENTSANAAANLIGRDGNDSLMTLVTSSGLVRVYDPWNGSAWNAGTLPYFEANNLYWVPFLNSYINIQADGATTDEIEQLELEGPGSGTSFVPVFGPVANGPGGIKSNGVNGLVFNLTLNEMAYNYGSGTGNVQTVYSFAQGVLATQVSYEVVKSAPYGRVVTDDHRLSVTTGAPVLSGFYDPDFYNQSWAVNPFSGQYYDTNEEVGYLNPTDPDLFDSSAGYDGEAAHEFLNATSAITGYSVNCASTVGTPIPCPLLGTTPGTTLGTVYYVSALPEGRFPYPAAAPISQSGSPPPLVLGEVSTYSTVTVTWDAPSLYPILNFTLDWGLSAATMDHRVNLASNALEYTISGLSSEERVYYGVTVTDLNSASPIATGSAVTPPQSAPSPPTELSVASFGPTMVNLTWRNPSQPLLNDTVDYATNPEGPFVGISEGVVTSATVDGLSDGTQYYIEATTWNSTGESPSSNEVTVRTPGPPLAPNDLVVTGLTMTSVNLSWTNPAGTLVNDTLHYATDSAGPFATLSEGVSVAATASGLAGGTQYYFEVTAWNTTGQSSPSSEASATTISALPSSPTNLSAVTINETAIRLSWDPPPGLLLNYTLEVNAQPGVRPSYLNVVDGAVSSYVVGGLAPSTTYFFTARAWTTGGAGNASNIASATTASPSVGGLNGISSATLLVVVLAILVGAAVLYFLLRRRGKRARGP